MAIGFPGTQCGGKEELSSRERAPGFMEVDSFPIWMIGCHVYHVLGTDAFGPLYRVGPALWRTQLAGWRGREDGAPHR